MSRWLPTSCALCAQNCGLLVKVENNRIVNVKGDRDNPRSAGYLCRKGQNIANFQHHAERLTKPLKKTAEGFVEISWEQALTEIGARLRSIVGTHGPRSYAFMGGGGQANHFEAAFGTSLMRGLGSHYHYNALAQELTGFFWCAGRMLGRQNRFPIPDEHQADMLVGIGWNGMESHQMPRAPLVIREFAKNPDKLLVIIDPRESRTAKEANIHVPLRPGTDALFTRAMIAIILQEGWEDSEYLDNFCTGFEEIRGWFENFDIHKALEVCHVDFEQVRNVCREMTSRSWCLHFDLGVYMNRHSTLATYLHMLLLAVCGRFCVPGGNVIPGAVMPIGSHSDERLARTWRTVETDFPAILGCFPPNVMPEEILSGKDDRLRAVVVSSSNPVRSYADTSAYEKAFKELDLLVTVEITMSETAELSDYVLPARTAYESYDASFFTWNYPEIFFQMRHPVVEPEPETRESGTILAAIGKAAGLLPELPDYLYEAGEKDRLEYTMALLTWLQRNRKYSKLMPLIIAETRKKGSESINLDALWSLFLVSPPSLKRNVARAGVVSSSKFGAFGNLRKILRAVRGVINYRSVAPLAILTPQVSFAEKLFNKVVESPSGLWLGKSGDDNIAELMTKDKMVNLYIPEMAEWIKEIQPELEEKALQQDADYPFVLNAGRHKPENANTLMRKPDWNEGRRTCTLAMNPVDAESLGIVDGETVKVITEAGQERIELEVTGEVRQGQVLIPHGFGLKYRGEVHGINVNRLTKNTHRDRLAATPLHRYVRCRVEKVGEGTLDVGRP
ncbi:molybdopterin-containing oxidoreductase family protein [Desulfosediminicola ganghwensis]|uniref:molybdopterin-containing oxidoreductase family protein n=1 Tax=Desulfosediminicola ganghwensis TaxID=2569540 RepID=UPI0010AD9215|nr:molybdopterin-dependent oxidoreductase [Desulfosediminicola ganghwensis]